MNIIIKTGLGIFLLSTMQATWGTNAKLTSGDYKNRSDVEAFIDKMAAKKYYTQDQLITLFSHAKQQTRLFKKMNNAAEHKLSWHSYRRIFLKKNALNRVLTFIKNTNNYSIKSAKNTRYHKKSLLLLLG